ncbi:MAG: hypothetical protein HKO57_16065 [Akkermansiaceae bacterium]|nr:hypothetical protein [Akkermansiaceae bacterium]
MDLALLGTAVEGVHINSVPRSIIIPAGQASSEVAITTAAGWDGAMTRMALLRVETADAYLVGHPHEATLYAAAAAPDPDESGFDRWLAAATGGQITTLHDLIRSEGATRVNAYLHAYAYGHESPDSGHGSDLTFRLVDDRPELTARLASSAADLRWQIQSAADAAAWADVTDTFGEESSPDGHRFTGPAIDPAEGGRYYRLAFALHSDSGLAPGVDGLAGSSRYGMTGVAPWEVDAATGALVTTADAPGTASRLIVEITDPTVLDFEISVQDGDGADVFTFHIDGVPVAATSGEAVRVSRSLQPSAPVTLMWEFHRSTGTARIEVGAN